MSPLSRWLVLVATFGLVSVSTPAAIAADDSPVLWTGRIQAPSAGGVPAAVTAYLQPTADTAVAEEGVQLVAISSTSADPNGNFILRAAYDEQMRAAEDPPAGSQFSSWRRRLTA